MGNLSSAPEGGISPLTSSSAPTAGLRLPGVEASQQQSLFRPYRPKAPLNLFPKKWAEGLPLQRLSVEGDLVDLCARLTITQVFVNNVPAPADSEGGLECVYTFPVEELASGVATCTCPLVVCGVEVEIGGTRVVAEVQPKQEAIDAYDDAISSGHGAYLIERVQGLGYRMSIGNLPAGQTATITLRCVQQLTPLVSGDLQFTLSHGLVPPSCGDFSLALDMRQTTPGGIKSVTCTTHPECEVVLDDGRARTYLTSKNALCDDVVFEISPHSPHEPNALVENYEPSPGQNKHEDLTHPQAAMLTFHPRWEVDSDLVKHQTELIFLIDRSGSMAGSRMDIAKATLQLFLRSLPEGVRFNIFSFGSHFSSQFDTSVEYDEQSLARAHAHVNAMSADMCGTVLLTPLQHILRQREHEGYSRQIFLLTDGEVPNADKVIKLVRKQAGTTRIFTFAIGNEADKNMLQELALCGRGAMEFVSEVEHMKVQVMRQLQKALEPAMTNTKLRLISRDGSDKHWRCTSRTIRPIFSGERLVLYALSSCQGEWAEDHQLAKAELTGVGPTGEELNFELFIDADHTTTGRTLHQLAAVSRIRGLKGNHRECKNLGLAYSLATSQTSFVAIEERDRAALGTMRKYEERGGSAVVSKYRSSTVAPSAWSSQQQPLLDNDAALDHLQQQVQHLKNISDSIQSELDTQSSLLDSLDAQTELVEAKNFMRSSKRLSSWGVGSFFSGLAAAASSSFNSLSATSSAPAKGSTWSSSSSSSSTSSSTGAAVTNDTNSGTATTKALEKLILLQRANGTWTLQAMEDFLQISLPLPALLAATDTASLLWATLVALAVLERVFGDKRDEWRLLAQKATLWVKRSTASILEPSALSELTTLSLALNLPRDLTSSTTD